jgi:hypothetical protein
MSVKKPGSLTDLLPLTRPAAPWFHLLVAPAVPYDALRGLETTTPGVVVRFVRGRKAATKAALLDELAAALQFPPDFGGNWDALHDALCDLSWLRATAVVICINEANHLLEAEPDELPRLAQVLSQAATHRNKAGKSFHVVLHAAPAAAAAVQKRWQAAGLTPARLAGV